MGVKMSIEEVAYTDAMKKRNVPEHLQEGLLLYLCDGILPGHFMRAVLENDLVEAFSRADPESLAGLHSLVLFLQDVPRASWGCPYTVKTWALDHRRAGGAS